MTLRCREIIRADHHQADRSWDGTITLDETDRHRRRITLTSDQGLTFLLDLPETTLLRHCDTLQLDDGRKLKVLAKPESLYRISARNREHLLMLTWHVGNRHLATAIQGEHLLIREDPVIKTMLEELGASVECIQEPFNPLGGAYSDQHSHSHA